MPNIIKSKKKNYYIKKNNKNLVLPSVFVYNFGSYKKKGKFKMKWIDQGISLFIILLSFSILLSSDTLKLRFKGSGIDIVPSVNLSKDYYTVFEMKAPGYDFYINNVDSYEIKKIGKYLFIKPLNKLSKSTLNIIEGKKIYIIKIKETENKDLFNEKIIISLLKEG
jgi:hypothetical protein